MGIRILSTSGSRGCTVAPKGFRSLTLDVALVNEAGRQAVENMENTKHTISHCNSSTSFLKWFVHSWHKFRLEFARQMLGGPEHISRNTTRALELRHLSSNQRYQADILGTCCGGI